ncbi:MAG: hypothetical protein ACP5KJ_04150, partial [Candidatus Micrarchaeia archaeon]
MKVMGNTVELIEKSLANIERSTEQLRSIIVNTKGVVISEDDINGINNCKKILGEIDSRVRNINKVIEKGVVTPRHNHIKKLKSMQNRLDLLEILAPDDELAKAIAKTKESISDLIKNVNRAIFADELNAGIDYLYSIRNNYKNPELKEYYKKLDMLIESIRNEKDDERISSMFRDLADTINYISKRISELDSEQNTQAKDAKTIQSSGVKETSQTEKIAGPKVVVKETSQTEKIAEVVNETSQTEKTTGPKVVVKEASQTEKIAGTNVIVNEASQTEKITGPKVVVKETSQTEKIAEV